MWTIAHRHLDPEAEVVQSHLRDQIKLEGVERILGTCVSVTLLRV